MYDQEDQELRRPRLFPVELELLRRLLDPYLSQIGLDWDGLPEDETERLSRLSISSPAPTASFRRSCSSCSTTSRRSRPRPGPGSCRRSPPRRVSTCWQVCAARARQTTEGSRRGSSRLSRFLIILQSWTARSGWGIPRPRVQAGTRRERAGAELRHDDPAVQAAFAEAVRAWVSGRCDGHFREVHWFDEDDLLRILVLHGSKAETKNVDRDKAEDTVKFREIVQSTLEYDRRRGAIAVGSKSFPDAKKLARIFGEHVVGDAEIFEASAAEELTASPRFRPAGHPSRSARVPRATSPMWRCAQSASARARGPRPYACATRLGR